MTGATKGLWLAIANLIVVGLGLGVSEATHPGDIFGIMVLVVIIGGVPAVIAGLCLGCIAEALAKGAAPRGRHRLPILAAGACLLVIVLGGIADAPVQAIVFSCVPTVAACSILDRWTRPSLASAPVPPAHALG